MAAVPPARPPHYRTHVIPSAPALSKWPGATKPGAGRAPHALKEIISPRTQTQRGLSLVARASCFRTHMNLKERRVNA